MPRKPTAAHRAARAAALPWVIRSLDPDTYDGQPLYWSNVDGWVSLDTADRWSDADRTNNRLPFGGIWCDTRQQGATDAAL